jgi:hypothetical protein
MLPPASAEQRAAVDLFCDARANVVVEAVAGAGKSTLLLHICERLRAERVVVVAYNAPLAHEMNERIEALGLVHARAFTFHSLASHVYGLCPDDSTLFELVAAARHGRLAPRAVVEADHLLLDEMQDCRELYFALLRCVFSELPHSLLCGDREQMLYDFEEDDPATLTYLDEPARQFGGGAWTRTRLATSFRLTPPLAALVNGVKDGERLVAGNSGDAPRLPVVVTCGTFQWVDKLMPHLLELLRHYPLERVAVLVRSVRTSHAGVRTFVNAITSRQIPVYVHGVDSPVGRAGKLTVCTYYAAKGLTFDATLVVGLSETTAPNPMYVALSRARCAQVVALDRFRPPRRVLRALADVPARLCPQTRAFVRHGYDDPPSEESYEPGVRDLTGWAPRGRAPELHEAVRTTTTSDDDAERLPTEVRTTAADGLVDEISKLYVLAALCAEEHRRTGRCARLRYLNNPVRATANERKRKLCEEEDFHDRIVDSRARADELLPPRLRALLRHALLHEPDEARRWLALAAAFVSCGEYHHVAERLLPSLEWVDGALFAQVRARVAAHVGKGGGRFDALVRRRESLAVCRCDLLADRAAYTFVYEDRLTSTLRACTPMVLDDGAAIDRCVLVNVRTGEVATSVVLDRAPFLARMQLVVVTKKEEAPAHADQPAARSSASIAASSSPERSTPVAQPAP